MVKKFGEWDSALRTAAVWMGNLRRNWWMLLCSSDEQFNEQFNEQRDLP